MEFTLGELIARRKLRTVGRVPSYSPGQHEAKIVGSKAILSYVDMGGAVCIIPCEKTNDEWFHLGFAFRVGHATAEVRYLPRSWPMSAEMRDALVHADKEGAPRRRSKTARGSQAADQES